MGTVRKVVMSERSGPDKADEQMLRNLAYHCAEHKCCVDYPNHDACNQCKYNVANYTDWNHARLLVADAQINERKSRESCERYYRSQIKENKKGSFRFLLTAGVITFLVIYGCNSINNHGYIRMPLEDQMRSRATNSVSHTSSPAIFTPIPTEPQSSLPTQEQAVADIQRVLREMNGTVTVIRSSPSYSGPAHIPNCQDYAAWFHRRMPSSRIIYNGKLGDGTGHVFNAVQTTAGWIYIEPQNIGGRWLMRDAWPDWERHRNASVDQTSRFRR